MPKRKPAIPSIGDIRANTSGGQIFDAQILRTPVVAPEDAVFDAPPPLNNDDQADDGHGLEFEGQMARLTEVPTKSTNPPRPRTRAAGYDGQTRTLSVVFRDGTPWNYYDVSPLEAANFRRATSKGRFIRLYLDGKRNGPPSDNGYRFTDLTGQDNR